MSSPLDRLGIEPAIVRAGLSDWEAASRHLEEIRTAAAALLGTNLGGIFGGDTPGRTALASFMQNGGPQAVLFGEQGGGGVIAALAESGPAMGRLLDELLAQDDADAAAIRAAGDPAARA